MEAVYLIEEHLGDLVVAHLGRLEERRDVVRPHLVRGWGSEHPLRRNAKRFRGGLGS